MSQHDYNIANGGGAAVRADINNALLAILSQNSGATAPTTTKPFMPWYDTTTGYYKMRNSADSAWIGALQAVSDGAITKDASGNVGIGSVSPAAKLHLDTTAAPSGTTTNSLRVTAGNYGGQINGYITQGVGHGLTFSTVDNGTATERARIDSSGNLLVGTSQPADTSGPGAKIVYDADNSRFLVTSTRSTSSYSNLNMYSTTAGTYRFYVNWAGTINATSTTITGISDQRLKENIRDLDDGLDKVMALQPRKFDWKEGKGQNIKDARGFIAQEFETVFPDMIEEWLDPAPEGEEPYKAVNANLIPTLVKAIQEQQAIITSLTARIAALENANV